MKFIRRLFSRKRKEVSFSESEDPLQSNSPGHESRMIVDTEGLSPSSREAVYGEIAKSRGFPVHEGRVEHAYSGNVVYGTEICPRCRGQTRQEYASFIYATNMAPRVMFAPAGFFCLDCPTVIIDQEMIVAGVKKGFTFQGVVGIDYEGKKEPDFFRTWNGKEAVYILDEDGRPMGISTSGGKSEYLSKGKISRAKRSLAKRKRRMAKENRRRNRPK